MSDTNKAVLTGRLTNDPVIRFVGQQDIAVCEFGMAMNRVYGKEEDGSQKRETTFVDITVWGRQGENCEKYLKKGSHVLVDGRLQQHNWETKEGEKRSKIRVVADNVNFLDPAKSNGKAKIEVEESVEENVAVDEPVSTEPSLPAKTRGKKVVKDSDKSDSNNTNSESTKPSDEYIPF